MGVLSQGAADDRAARADKNLAAYLAQNSLTLQDVLDEVEPVFGAPCLVFVSGSVVAGLGNGASDIDLVALVEAENVSSFPVSSYKQDKLIDAAYQPAARLLSRLAAVESSRFPGPDFPDASTWHDRYALLQAVTRFAVSSVLDGGEAWRDRHKAVQQGPLRQRISDFWIADSLRRALAARWLCERNPLLAYSRMSEAIMYGVDAHLARQGDIYLAPKWIPAKAERSGEAALVDAVAVAQAFPRSSAEAAPQLRRASDTHATLLADVAFSAYEFALQLPGDALSYRAEDELVVTRHGFRGAIVSHLKVDGQTLWRGGWPDSPPAWAIDLLGAGLAWLSVRERD
jgi:hypothetical protein